MDKLYPRVKPLFPDADDQEIQQGLQEIRSGMPDASDDDIMQGITLISDEIRRKLPASEPAPAQPKPDVKSYLTDKYGLDKRRQIEEQNNSEQEGFNWAAFTAGLGSSIAGRGASGTDDVLNMQAKRRQDRLAQFDTGRKQAMEDIDLDFKLEDRDFQRQDQAFKGEQQERQRKEWKYADNDRDRKLAESDPTSPESRMAQQLAAKMLPNQDFSQVSAAQITKTFPMLNSLYSAEISRSMEESKLMEKLKQEQQAKMEKERQTQLRTMGDPTRLLIEEKIPEVDKQKAYDQLSLRAAAQSGIDDLYANYDEVSNGRMDQAVFANYAATLLSDYQKQATGKVDQNAIINTIREKIASATKTGGDVNSEVMNFVVNSIKTINDKETALLADYKIRPELNLGSQYKLDDKKTIVKKQYNPAKNQTKLIYSDKSEEVVDGKQ